jgi:hypothetical protein
MLRSLSGVRSISSSMPGTEILPRGAAALLCGSLTAVGTPPAKASPAELPRVLVHSHRAAGRRALVALTVILAELGLELKQAKTRIVHLKEDGEGLDFLGFHHRWVRGNTPRSRHLRFLARWPSRQATQHARDRIRGITGRRRLRVPVTMSCRTSTASCAAGRATSATETRPDSSTRSTTTRWTASLPRRPALAGVHGRGR